MEQNLNFRMEIPVLLCEVIWVNCHRGGVGLFLPLLLLGRVSRLCFPLF